VVEYEVIGQSFEDFAKTRSAKATKATREAEGMKDVKVTASDSVKTKKATLDVKAYATYATTSTKEAGLMGFGGVNNDDDEAPRGGNRGGRGGGRGGSNAGAGRPKKQTLTNNDEEFPAL